MTVSFSLLPKMKLVNPPFYFLGDSKPVKSFKPNYWVLLWNLKSLFCIASPDMILCFFPGLHTPKKWILKKKLLSRNHFFTAIPLCTDWENHEEWAMQINSGQTLDFAFLKKSSHTREIWVDPEKSFHVTSSCFSECRFSQLKVFNK